MPDPTRPHEDCTETVTHWHDVPAGDVLICPRTEGRQCPLHAEPGFRCYAPRTQPTPLDAILTAADDANRAHDRLCDLAETLLPESSPVKTADNPAVVLPTVDEAAEAVVQSTRVEGWSYRTTAQAVLDLIAARVPAWVPVEPGTVIKAGTHYRIEWDDASSASGASATERHSSFDFTPCPTDPGRYSIDPRTVPAEPEDPAEMFRDALIAVTGEPLRYLSSIGTDEMAAALNAAGLDLTPRADR